MLVIAVKGSPRKDGKTNKIIDEIIRGSVEVGHEVKEYNVGNMALQGCQACYACKERVTDCVIEDGLKAYFSDLHSAAVLILGAPNYASGVCGQMVSFMNRHYCLVDEERDVHIPSGIKVIGVFGQGQPDKEKYIDMYRWYMSDFQRRNMELIDIIVTSRADDEPGKSDEILKKAYEIGKSLKDKRKS